LVGVVNINAIIRGAFQNGSLGFYAFEGYQRRGLMSAGLRRVIDFAFTKAALHRLEANIQPDNEVSRRLIARLGFRSEGVARRLLRVNGQWRDHERFALTVEEWETGSSPQ
jgi:ribosomal-protein-alanine N-acetyltransferase